MAQDRRLKALVIEGVPYVPFLVRFSTLDGRRRVKTLWAPECGPRAWLHADVCAYLEDRGDVDADEPVTVRCKS